MAGTGSMSGMSGHQHHGSGETPQSHGMIVFGTSPVFLSHLPMFMKNHDYQVVLQASFNADEQQVYEADRTAHPGLLYTLQPEAFTLPELLAPGPGKPPARRSFRASLFRGHFEQPDADTDDIVPKATVSVGRVVVGKKFDPGAAGLEQLEYVLFGSAPDLWLVHVLTKPPDFDHILSVDVDGHAFSDEELGAGIPITIAGRSNVAEERLGVPPGGPPVDAVATVGSGSVPVRLTAGADAYFNDNSDLQ